MEIRREILNKLKAWKDSPYRKPLVMQGARQVGKSWMLMQFGRQCFANYVYVNFDTNPEIRLDFAKTKEPKRLISSLEMMFGQKIKPDETLIILDEIQECNDALNSLKYFCETAPEYAVACAGSLLGVALNRHGASFPVGKVDFITMYPLSFAEYLAAVSPDLYLPFSTIGVDDNMPEMVHSRLIDGFKVYLALGGMPEAVSRYADNHDWVATDAVLDGILKSYTLDFSKHISNKDIPRVFQVWGNLQDQLGRANRKFRYADIMPSARAREFEAAIEWLCLSGLVHRVNDISTPRLPLSAYKDSNAFKLYLSDVGLLRSKFRLDASAAIQGNTLFTEFKGALTENYILQSLVRQFGEQQFYWTSGNTAEVEFVLQHKNDIIPIEVKADINVKAKSLSLYRKTYAPRLSVRFSARNMRKDDDLLNLPLYMVDRLSEYLNKCR